MSYLIATAGWDDVYKIESSDAAIGGLNTAICNKQAQALLNRTQYLYNLVQSLETQYLASIVPFGTIKLWWGTQETVPEGWKICDGANGMPDLKNKFPLGIDYDQLYNQSKSTSRFAAIFTCKTSVSHTHYSYTAPLNGSHYHYDVQSGAVDTPSNQGYEWRGGGSSLCSMSHTHEISFNAAGAHEHTITFDEQSHTHPITILYYTNKPLPPHMNIFYIMKAS